MSDIDAAVAAARAAKGIETVADDEHHAMMNGPRIRQAMGMECPHGRPKDDCGFCAANERAAEMVQIIEVERASAVHEFMDAVLGALKRMGIETDDCDGEDAPEVIFSAWIYTQIVHARSSLGGGGLGKGENATPKEATDNVQAEPRRTGGVE